MKEKNFTEEWRLYEKGKEYNRSLGLYERVSTNERFYRGDQWEGVAGNGLPKPVFNIFKRIINFYTANILSSAVKMRFSYAEPTGAGSSDSEQAAAVLNAVCERRWEKLKLDSLLADALTECAITGDAVFYTFWDASQRTGQAFRGDFRTVLTDNTNVFFGNPNTREVQKQPYILISMRENAEDVRRQAKAAGRSNEEIARIIPDGETEDQSGDLARKELENTRCITLVKLWKNDEEHICYRKSARGAIVTDTVETKLTLYPICFMNWTKAKASWHGEAVATGLIENQIFINKGFAMVMKHMMDTAFSKVVYDGTLIEEWSNRVGEAIKVDGPVENVAKILPPGQMQTGMLDVLSLAIANTKECLGATDTALGNVQPNNTSAILALQQASVLPLENIRRQFYQFIEDLGLVWLDHIFAYYDDARLIYRKEESGKNSFVPLQLGQFRGALYDCKIDVGAVNYWSEISCLNTLDNLLTQGKITTVQYLERLPQNLISKKDSLIKELERGTQIHE